MSAHRLDMCDRTCKQQPCPRDTVCAQNTCVLRFSYGTIFCFVVLTHVVVFVCRFRLLDFRSLLIHSGCMCSCWLSRASGAEWYTSSVLANTLSRHAACLIRRGGLGWLYLAGIWPDSPWMSDIYFFLGVAASVGRGSSRKLMLGVAVGLVRTWYIRRGHLRFTRLF